MTRQEEYYKEASKYASLHHSKADNDFQTAMSIAVQKAFVAGAKWADQYPKEGLMDVKKVEQWIIDCFAFLNDAGHHNFKVDKFIENFRRAMEE